MAAVAAVPRKAGHVRGGKNAKPGEFWHERFRNPGLADHDFGVADHMGGDHSGRFGGFLMENYVFAKLAMNTQNRVARRCVIGKVTSKHRLENDSIGQWKAAETYRLEKTKQAALAREVQKQADMTNDDRNIQSMREEAERMLPEERQALIEANREKPGFIDRLQRFLWDVFPNG